MNITKLLETSPPAEIDHNEARQAWHTFRMEHGYKSDAPLLTPPDANAKMAKSGKPDYALSLAPAISSGHNVCPFSTPECRATCVSYTGRGGKPSIQLAREVKVQFLATNPSAFCTLIKHELIVAVTKHGAIGCRLNAFSDIAWERLVPWMLTVPGVQFYDYTKDWGRTSTAGYRLTFSASERTSDTAIADRVSSGHNVAVVFSIKHRPGAKSQSPMLARFLAQPVIDGDKSDTRYSDPLGVVVGLRAKGKAAQLPVGGFVRQAITQ